MILPFLPKEDSTDLTPHGFPGVVVRWRPMDLYDMAKWGDRCRGDGVDAVSIQGRLLAFQQQLIAVEGLEVTPTEGSPAVPFDGTKHIALFPMDAFFRVWSAIEMRSMMTEDLAKNSEGPSASGEASGTAASLAEGVVKDKKMSSTAS